MSNDFKWFAIGLSILCTLLLLNQLRIDYLSLHTPPENPPLYTCWIDATNYARIDVAYQDGDLEITCSRVGSCEAPVVVLRHDGQEIRRRCEEWRGQE